MKKLYIATLLAVIATTFTVSSAVASMLAVTNTTTSCNVEVHQLGNAYGSALTNTIVGAGPEKNNTPGSNSISGIVVSPGEKINFEVIAIDKTDSKYVAGYATIAGVAGRFEWSWNPSNTVVSGSITSDNFGNATLVIAVPPAGTFCK